MNIVERYFMQDSKEHIGLYDIVDRKDNSVQETIRFVGDAMMYMEHYNKRNDRIKSNLNLC
jgi:hypothetical protein